MGMIRKGIALTAIGLGAYYGASRCDSDHFTEALGADTDAVVVANTPVGPYGFRCFNDTVGDTWLLGSDRAERGHDAAGSPTVSTTLTLTKISETTGSGPAYGHARFTTPAEISDPTKYLPMPDPHRDLEGRYDNETCSYRLEGVPASFIGNVSLVNEINSDNNITELEGAIRGNGIDQPAPVWNRPHP